MCQNQRMNRVAGKVAFITGAARGQGRSHAVRLAQEGADIIAVDLAETVPSVARFYPGATEADLAETVRLVEATGRRIVATRADVRDSAALGAALERGVEQLGGLDIVVANAGIFRHGEKVHEIAEDDWDDIVAVNLKGVFLTCKVAVPRLIAQGRGGSIIIISSAAGLHGSPHLGAYAASKHGLVGLMRTLANEVGEHRIRVNTVHPTGVATDMILNDAMFRIFEPSAETPTADEAARVFQAEHALPVPWVEVEDVSNAVLFLASDESRYVTGTELKVDAGFTIA
jgi:SDR family mycofactocin-dependent oxidoreductase